MASWLSSPSRIDHLRSLRGLRKFADSEDIDDDVKPLHHCVSELNSLASPPQSPSPINAPHTIPRFEPFAPLRYCPADSEDTFVEPSSPVLRHTASSGEIKPPTIPHSFSGSLVLRRRQAKQAPKALSATSGATNRDPPMTVIVPSADKDLGPSEADFCFPYSESLGSVTSETSSSLPSQSSPDRSRSPFTDGTVPSIVSPHSKSVRFHLSSAETDECSSGSHHHGSPTDLSVDASAAVSTQHGVRLISGPCHTPPRLRLCGSGINMRRLARKASPTATDFSAAPTVTDS